MKSWQRTSLSPQLSTLPRGPGRLQSCQPVFTWLSCKPREGTGCSLHLPTEQTEKHWPSRLPRIKSLESSVGLCLAASGSCSKEKIWLFYLQHTPSMRSSSAAKNLIKSPGCPSIFPSVPLAHCYSSGQGPVGFTFLAQDSQDLWVEYYLVRNCCNHFWVLVSHSVKSRVWVMLMIF